MRQVDFAILCLRRNCLNIKKKRNDTVKIIFFVVVCFQYILFLHLNSVSKFSFILELVQFFCFCFCFLLNSTVLTNFHPFLSMI